VIEHSTGKSLHWSIYTTKDFFGLSWYQTSASTDDLAIEIVLIPRSIEKKWNTTSWLSPIHPSNADDWGYCDCAALCFFLVCSITSQGPDLGLTASPINCLRT
jgi:hypothetical protein